MVQAPEEALDIFAAAVSVLRGDHDLPPDAHDSARALLDELGYRAGPSAAYDNRQALLLAAARLKRLFRLGAPDTPGLAFFGGLADPAAMTPELAGCEVASLAGAGLQPAEAFAACVGEGAEYLSQFELEEDRGRRMSGAGPRIEGAARAFLAAWMGRRSPEALDRLPWVPAIELAGGAASRLPADLVFRRGQGPRFTARVPLGSGCAAGPGWERALLSALLEAIERDAVALWWHGGSPAAPVPDEVLAAWGTTDFLAELRGGRTGRRLLVLDITSDIGIGCLAAISFDASGRGFAGGYAAGLDPAATVRRAVIEMCQMELGRHLIEVKLRHSGRRGLNAAERRHLARATSIAPADCLAPARAFRSDPWQFGPGRPSQETAHIVDRLAQCGYVPYAVNLTRALLAIPVAKVVVPGLQPYPSTFLSPRLAALGLRAATCTPQHRRLGLF